MRVQRYPATDIAEAEQLSYAHTALALERALWGTFEVGIETYLGGTLVDTHTQQASPGQGYLSDLTMASGLPQNQLRVAIDFSHSLPLPRLPHEYRAWLA